MDAVNRCNNTMRNCKPSHEKENQQKYVNKKTDLLSSLHNIKLPLQPSISNHAPKFRSLSLTSSILVNNVDSPTLSTARHKHARLTERQLTPTEEYCKIYGD